MNDSDFNPNVAHPAYPTKHPKVLFDEAHNNADRSGGRYQPFADLIISDGFSVVPNTVEFSADKLKGFDILVIVNATGPSSRRELSALTEEECDSVRDWVKAGGALLLITDHSPFSNAVTPLAKRFAVDLTNGYTIDSTNNFKQSNDETELLFTRTNGLLVDHPITMGRNDAERIEQIVTFSGTSLKGPSGSVAFLKLSDTAKDVLPPENPKPVKPEEALPEHRPVSAAGRAQGVAFQFEKGRVVVLTEAAMLTAQIAPQGFRFGMNVPGIDNRQLALNIMHWLSGLLK